MKNRNFVFYVVVLTFPLFTWGQLEFFVNRDLLSLADLKEEDQNMTDGTLRWQCFDAKLIRYACSFVRPLDREGSSLSFDIRANSASHFYSHSHAISGEVCNRLLADLRAILKNQRQFCILGTLDDVKVKDRKKEYSWSFYRIKTKSGYVHYRLPEGS